jgi:hypothetical protein
MTRDITELHAIVEQRVLGWLDEPELQVAVRKFPTAVYHLVAALGTLPDAETMKICGEIRSQRVIDPIFRVLRGLVEQR